MRGRRRSFAAWLAVASVALTYGSNSVSAAFPIVNGAGSTWMEIAAQRW